MYTCICIHVHTCMHTYIHTYIHAYNTPFNTLKLLGSRTPTLPFRILKII